MADAIKKTKRKSCEIEEEDSEKRTEKRVCPNHESTSQGLVQQLVKESISSGSEGVVEDVGTSSSEEGNRLLIKTQDSDEPDCVDEEPVPLIKKITFRPVSLLRAPSAPVTTPQWILPSQSFSFYGSGPSADVPVLSSSRGNEEGNGENESGEETDGSEGERESDEPGQESESGPEPGSDESGQDLESDQSVHDGESDESGQGQMIEELGKEDTISENHGYEEYPFNNPEEDQPIMDVTHMQFQSLEEHASGQRLLNEMLSLTEEDLANLHLTPEEIESGGADYITAFEFSGDARFLGPLGNQAGARLLKYCSEKNFNDSSERGRYLLKWLLRTASLGLNNNIIDLPIISSIISLIKTWIDNMEDHLSYLNNYLPVYLDMLKGTSFDDDVATEISLLNINPANAIEVLAALKSNLPASTANILAQFNPQFY